MKFVQGIPRLQVFDGVVFGLELVGRRRFHVLDFPTRAGTDPKSGQLVRIGSPDEGFPVVFIARDPLKAHWKFVFPVRGSHVDVMIPDKGFPLAVGRGNRVPGGRRRRSERGRPRAGRRADFHASVGGQIAFPFPVSEFEFNGPFLVHENDAVERKIPGVMLFPGRPGERGGELFMIERRPLDDVIRVHQNEFKSSPDRFPITEPVRSFRPNDGTRDVQGGRPAFFLKLERPLIVRLSPLRRKHAGKKGQDAPKNQTPCEFSRFHSSSLEKLTKTSLVSADPRGARAVPERTAREKPSLDSTPSTNRQAQTGRRVSRRGESVILSIRPIFRRGGHSLLVFEKAFSGISLES